MSESIQIHKRIKPYGIVQQSLLQDTRLSTTARLLAAWLAVRPDGWKVWRCDVLRKLGIGEQAYLSARKQLIEVGYLVVSGQRRVENGRFSNAEMTFVEEPECSQEISDHNIFTAPLKSGYGEIRGAKHVIKSPINSWTDNNSSAPCLPGHGLPDLGEPGHLVLTTKESTFETLKEQPQLPQLPKYEIVVVGSEKLIWPDALSQFERDSITKIFSKQKLQQEHCQLLLDELEGALEVITIKNPVGWVRTLAAKTDFTPEHAGRIQAKRFNAQRLKAKEIGVVQKTAEQLEDGRRKALEARQKLKAMTQGS